MGANDQKTFLEVWPTNAAYNIAPDSVTVAAALTDYPNQLGVRRYTQESRGRCGYALRFNNSGSTIPYKSVISLGVDGQSCLLNATASLPWTSFGGVVQTECYVNGVLHATGVPTGYWFWAQVEGPTEVIADTGGLVAGSPCYGDTDAASGVMDGSTAITTVALASAVVGRCIDTVAAAATGTVLLGRAGG